MLIDTFSANSLKILEKDRTEFINKFIYNLSYFKKDKKALQGSKFHSLICYYIKGFKIDFLLNDLNYEELIFWQNLKEKLAPIKKKFIYSEYSFLIKDSYNNSDFFLTGRFDAISKDKDNYIIYDWKTLNIPLDPKNDLQTIVYLYCANKIFKTDKISMKYLSIEKLSSANIDFSSCEIYKNRICKIISKL